jgi:hypothetical protein
LSNQRNEKIIKESEVNSEKILERQKELQKTLEKQREEVKFDHNNSEVMQEKYSRLILDYQLLERDSLEILQVLISKDNLLSLKAHELDIAKGTKTAIERKLGNVIKGQQDLYGSLYEEYEQCRKRHIELADEYDELEAEHARIIVEFGNERKMRKEEFSSKISNLQRSIVREKRAKLFQSFSSASQGIFNAFLPPLMSRPLNTIIQAHSGLIFLGCLRDCSGLIFFLSIFLIF